MQKFISILAALLFCFPIFGQNLTADTILVRQIMTSAKSKPGVESVPNLKSARDILTKNGLAESVIMSDVLHQMASFLGNGRPQDLKEGIRTIEEAIRLRRKLLGNEHMELAKSLNNLGEFLTNSEPNRALVLQRESLAIRLKNLPADHPDVSTSYVQMARTFQVLGDLPEAVKFAKLGLEIRQKKLGIGHPKTLAAKNVLANTYFYKHDYEHAIENYEGIIENDKNEHSAMVARNNLGYCFAFVGQHDRAIALAENVLASNSEMLNAPGFQFKVLRLLAGVLMLKDDFGQASLTLEKALALENAVPGTESEDYCQAMLDLGRCLVEQGKPAEGLEKQQQALAIFLKNYPQKRQPVSAFYQGIGTAQQGMKQFGAAIASFSKEIEVEKTIHGPMHPALFVGFGNLAFAFAETGNFAMAFANLDTAFLCAAAADGSEKPNAMLQIGKVKLQILEKLTLHDSSEKTIGRVSEAVDQSLAVFKMLQKQQFSDEFVFEMQKKQREVFEKTLDLLDWLQKKQPSESNIRRGWELSERAKSLALSAAFQKAKAKKIAGVPDSILEKEKQIRLDLAFWEKQKAQKLDEKGAENDSTVLNIASKIFDLKTEAESFDQNLERNFPEYLKLKYGSEPRSIPQIQADLPGDDQTAVLAFCLGETAAHAFVITKKGAKFISLPLDFSLEDTVQTMLHGLTAWFEAPKSGQSLRFKNETDAEYLRTARFLHDRIFLPLAVDLRPKLLILPDGVLNLLPFEVLVSKNPARPDRFQTYDYLVKKYEIGYSWSATLQNELENRPPSQAENAMLAMAPFAHADTAFLNGLDFSGSRGLENFSPTELVPLPFSAAEIFAAQSILGGDAKFDTAATRPYFLENAPRHRVLLLATHADANPNFDELDWIAFAPPPGQPENALLFSREIYNLRLDADLVILSGCKTGQGRLRRSEGAMSLGRAFTGAGARSVVSSFWKASDTGTERLMREFFQNLKNGGSKTAALQQAKTALFHAPSDAEQQRYRKLKVNWTHFSHPYFWAGFALRGDGRPLR